ncbi:MAG: 3-hydroxyacyl-CoA dehydrogenase NAD-binding domain-containing protein, partial [Abditibacteriaceae bacterium]
MNPIHTKILIVGSGTMGSGIAQIAAVAGSEVILFDAFDGAAQKAK